MKNLFIIINICIFSLLVSAQKKDPVVFSVNKEAVRLSEFKKLYKRTENAPNRPTPKVFLEDLVRYEVGLQEARKRKYQKDPIIKERMEQEMYKLLLEREIGKKVSNIRINEKEMKARYKNNPELRTSHILIEFKPGATKKEKAIAKKNALEILKKVKTSKRSFEEQVKLYSDDTISKAAGGDVGYQSRVTVLPTYYNAALKLKKGQVSNKLVETRFGYHIIKLTGRRNYEQADKRQLRQIIFEEKRAKLFNSYFNRLKKNYKIRANAATVKGVKY